MALPAALRRLLFLPAYLYGVGILFWCFQGAAFTGFLKWWRIGGPRSDVQAVLCYLKAAFQYRIVKLPGPDVHQGKIMYLCNHRAWCDFFVDMWATGARGLPLSRLLVATAFPAFSSSLVAIKSILLFKRAGIKDTEKFNAWIDAEVADGVQTSLLVYPEGTRSQKNQSLPLKRGMLRYAFSRKLPVQAVVTAGKDAILNERQRWVHFGCTLVTGCSEVLESSSFDDFEEFMTAVQQLWDHEWLRVHSAHAAGDTKGLPLLEPHFHTQHYSTATLAKESAALGFWTAVMLGFAYYTIRALVALATSGPVGMGVVAVLGLWSAASLVAAWTLPVPAPRSGKGGGGSGGGVSSSVPVAAAGAAGKDD